jgi:glycosyltransferase involved in cell wall biosynthesis
MESKPRIIWITQFPLSNVSFGAITQQLLHPLKDKYDFYCLSFGYDGQPLDVGYTILPFSSSTHIDFYWKEIKPDLVVLFHAVVALPKIMAMGRFQEPSILYVPVEGHRVPPSYLPYFQHFDRIITPSKWSQDALARDKINAEIIPHGVNADFYPPYERKNEAFTYGYLGSNDMRKQVTAILDAFAKVKGKKQLNLATPIQGYMDLGEISKELNIVPKFQKAMGRGLAVTADKVREFYYGLNAYVGLGTEGFGLPALEAGGTGIPNIAMDYGASREVLGNAAMYVKPVTTQLCPLGRIGICDFKDVASAMQYLKEDENECKKLGQNGIARVKKFPWDIPVKQIDKIIQEELDARKQ